MSWHYKSPLSFPSLYPSTLREAATFPDIPVVLGSGDQKSMEQLAEKFRWYKWCVKQHKESFELTNILESFDVRASIKQDEVGFILFLTAKKTKVSEFERLNPILAAEILPLCQ